jgi:hypothetical protein
MQRPYRVEIDFWGVADGRELGDVACNVRTPCE